MIRKTLLLALMSLSLLVLNSCGDDDSGFDAVDAVGSTTGGGVCTPQCANRKCGPNGCGGFCGVCPAGQQCNTVGQCGNSNTNCTPNCTGKTCGSNGCGGTCGTCPQGQQCTSQGGCATAVCTAQCAGKQCGGDNCGGTCGNCPAGWGCNGAGRCVTGECLPQCQTKVCGDDGCGNQCGKCPPGQLCIDNGTKCKANNAGCGKINETGECQQNGTIATYCTGGKVIAQACNTAKGYVCQYNPNKKRYDCVQSGCSGTCNGKQCGPDGCGGLCGKCPPNFTCNGNGMCQPVGACTPNCTGKQCGPNGCGGSCGECAQGLKCGPTGMCINPGGCIPNCSGKVCGNDGCGGTCGTCKFNQVCKNSQCIDPNCQPQCTAKECGPDGCGGLCGSCPLNQNCDSGQHCVTPGNGGCGTLPLEGKCNIGNTQLTWCEGGNIKSQNCTQFGADFVCSWLETQGYYWCLSKCEANCSGKECGDDGCGASCGQCPSGKSCSAVGKCEAAGGNCGNITYKGVCEGNTLKYCAGGNLATKNCGALGKTCQWSSSFEWYDCEDSGASGCTPNCLTKNSAGATVPKECGDDGCGNSCGNCTGGKVCKSGLCEAGQSDCGTVDYNGICEGQVLKYCANGSLVTNDCAAQNKVCKKSTFGWMACVEDESSSEGCGGITIEGICEGNVLKWCKNAVSLVVDDCSLKDKTCKTNESGYAVCD